MRSPALNYDFPAKLGTRLLFLCSPNSRELTPAKCLRLFVNGESIYCDRTTAIINHSTGQPYLCADVSLLSEHGIVNPLTAESIMYTWVHMCMARQGWDRVRKGETGEKRRHKKGTQKKKLTLPLPFPAGNLIPRVDFFNVILCISIIWRYYINSRDIKIKFTAD